MADRTPLWLLRALEVRDGRVCSWHGADSSECRVEQLVPQHRQGGAGGRVDKHRLSNVVWLCSILNGRIEAEAPLQAEADRRGISVPLNDDPERSPIVHPVHGVCLLQDDGSTVRLELASVDEALTSTALWVVDERVYVARRGMPWPL